MKNPWASLLVLCLCLSLWAGPAAAVSDEYDDSQSHPLRVAAYLVHPVAFLLEWTIFRPLHFLVSATPAQEALFGHTPHPTVLTDPQPFEAVREAPVIEYRPAARAGQGNPARLPEQARVGEIP